MTRNLSRRALGAVGVLVALALSAGTANATPDPDPAAPRQVIGAISPDLRDTSGTVEVVVQLTRPALTDEVTADAITDQTLPDAATQQAVVAAAESQQDAVAASAATLGATVVTAVSKAINAVVMTVDASQLDELARIPGVAAISRLANYQAPPDPGAAAAGSLAEAAAYLQADPARARGLTGAGVSVAVLDSGVDFTHANLAGPGTTDFYAECYGTPPATTTDEAVQPRNHTPIGACADYFGPDAPKVKGGYDFVGEQWTGAVDVHGADDPPLAPDPNPIDFRGHGTHVADIVGGHSADGSHLGLAPDVDLYGLKVCSALNDACSSAAILEAIDWALDPNGDGDMGDAVDIMNLSLSQPYGQPEDAVSAAVQGATRAGVVAVVSAGNAGDKPWIVGSASTAAGAISVAETALPSSASYPIRINDPTIPVLKDNVIRNVLKVDWAGPLQATTADLALASDAQHLGCDAAKDWANLPKGAVRYASRGTCSANQKALAAQAAGAVGIIIYNNEAGQPPSPFSTDPPLALPGIWVLSIGTDDGLAVTGVLGKAPVNISVDPAYTIPLANTVASTSARGPAIGDASIKPDLGSPGAWLSAVVGSGDGEENFSGTSGAAPTVAGAAAIVMQAHPRYKPLNVKRALIGNAATGTRTFSASGDFAPAAITRIGGGELRVEPAVTATGLAGDPNNGAGNLGVGVLNVTGTTMVLKKVTLKNTSDQRRTYSLSPSFLDPADAATHAVTVIAPPWFPVAAHSQAIVPVLFVLRGNKLPAWAYYDRASDTALGGATGNRSTLLDAAEFDGYLTITSNAGDRSHLGWQVLPKRAAAVTALSKQLTIKHGVTASLKLCNPGAADGVVNAFALTGTSEREPKPEPGDPGTPGSNAPRIDLGAVGVRDTPDFVQFAITQYGRPATPEVPARFQVEIDATGDGKPDFLVLNSDVARILDPGAAFDGRNWVYFYDINRNLLWQLYATDADYVSGNVIMTVPRSLLGLADGATLHFTVFALEIYFSGGATADAIENMTYTLGRPKYVVDQGPTFPVPAGFAKTTATVRATGATAPTTQTGVLLLDRVNAGEEWQAITVTTENPR